MTSPNERTTKASSGYAPVNGLEMYYEIEGTGNPLVYIPPAFGHAGTNSFPALVQSHSVITVDLQGNGRTDKKAGLKKVTVPGADLRAAVAGLWLARHAQRCCIGTVDTTAPSTTVLLSS